MNLKLTTKFVMTIVIINIIIFFINVIIGASALVKNSVGGLNLLETLVYKGTNLSPEKFTRNFGINILLQNGEFVVSEDGKAALDENKLWIQILDENGKELANYKKPKEVKEKYIPVELITAYKYRDGVEGLSNILMGGTRINNRELSYIISFPSNRLNRKIIMYDDYIIINFMKDALIVILIIDIMVAMVGGFLFSKRLTRPVKDIIDGIKTLANGDYGVEFENQGIYGNVHRNLNDLSRVLRANASERKNNEKMKEEWISNISHDLKTPLASIRGYAELITSDYGFKEDEIKEYGKIIQEKSLYITELVDDLNLSTRLKNNPSSLNKKMTNVVTLAKEVIISILNNNKYCEKNIEFISQTDRIEKEIDIILIKRCLNNLILNAIVHNDENVKIEVKLEKKDKIYIIISDNGKGINEEDLKHIFNRYYRGTNTGDVHKGSGLGMAISKEIIISHGGDINVKSEINNGTEIIIELV